MSLLKEYLKVKSAKTGNGIFTTVDIPAQTPILEVLGTIRSLKQLPDPMHPAILQIGIDMYIGPTGDFCDYINHSCEPNCAFDIAGTRAILYSLYFIKAGTELNFDYSTTSTDTIEMWSMDCLCGSFKCRKLISGYQYLDLQLQKLYQDKKMLPLYIVQPQLFQKYQ